MKLTSYVVPLAFSIAPGIVLAQKGQERQDQQGQRGAERAVVVQQPRTAAQLPARVRGDAQRTRDAAGEVDRRLARPDLSQRYRVTPRLSHGDVTRSLRADERANDIIARRRARKHHKHHKKD